MKKLKKKYLIFGAIGLIILVFILAKACGGKKEVMNTVTIEPISTATIIQNVSASGKIKPETEIKIAPEVSGEIIELTVNEGDEVKKGQLLVQIKPDVYISSLNRAKAAVQQAVASLEQSAARLKEATSEYKRSKSLFESGTIAKADWETIQTNYKVADLTYQASKSNLTSSQASLKEAEDNLTRTRIYSPIDGTISKLNVEQGERVVGTAQMAGTEVLRVANLDSMEVEVTVGENDIVKLAVGNPVAIEVDAYWGKKFKGTVTEIASSASNLTTSNASDQVTNFNVQIRIDQESYKDIVAEKNLTHTPFKPGMTASVDIQANKKDDIIVVPIKAVSTRQEKDTITKITEVKEVVFIYNKDKEVEKRFVVTGIQDDENIEIVSGVAKDEKVITGPYSMISKTLDAGTKVNVKEPKPKEDKK